MKNKKILIRKSGLAFPKWNALRSELNLTQKSGDLFYRMLFFTPRRIRPGRRSVSSFPVLDNCNNYKENSKNTDSSQHSIKRHYVPPLSSAVPAIIQRAYIAMLMITFPGSIPFFATNCPSTTIPNIRLAALKNARDRFSFCLFANSILNFRTNWGFRQGLLRVERAALLRVAFRIGLAESGERSRTKLEFGDKKW